MKSPSSIQWLMGAMIVIALLFSFYKYFFFKNYNFLVEAPCDVSTNECYVRDCEEEECPPNELSTYRMFAVSASRFGECTDNSCLNVCLRKGACNEMLCSDDEENTCAGPEAIAP